MLVETKPTIHNKFQLIVWKFLKEPDSCNWPKEIAIGKRLFKKYSRTVFWKWLDLGFRINSLAFFLTKKGKALLGNKASLFLKLENLKLNTKKDIKLRKNKVGKNVKLPNKKLKLLEFIDHGKKEKN